MAVQPGLCRTWSETPKTGFLRTRLIYDAASPPRFIKHHEGKKAPFVMVINPRFAKDQDLLDGAVEFLEYVRAAFEV